MSIPIKKGILLSFLCLPFLANAFSPEKNSSVIRFIENKGQWHDSVLYKAHIPGGQFFISQNTLTYQFWDQKQLSRYHHKKDSPGTLDAHVLKMHLQGASANSLIHESEPSETRYNFFKGQKSEKWAAGLHAYRKLRIESVYPGIDMVLEGRPNGIKYNFIVDPGANPAQIQMKWRGANDIFLDNGKLKLATNLWPLIEQKPVAFQGKEGKPGKGIACEFRLQKNTVEFGFPDDYNPNKRLVIDPEVIFATFSGSHADNFGFTGTFDSAGHAYSGGTVYSTGFPTFVGGYEADFQGGEDENPGIGDIARDAGILKYNREGSQLLYATYLGGEHNEQPHSMVVNNKNELVVFGTTYSWGFPVTNDAIDRTYNGGGDIFLTIFSPDGSQIRASTFMGGSSADGLNGRYLGGTLGYRNIIPLGYNYGDLYRGEVITDKNNNVYIATCTRSKDFPTTPGTLNTQFQGGYQDGCVAKLNPELSTLNWSTFIGGSSADASYSLKLDTSNNVYTAGGTMSSNFHELNNGWQNQIASAAVDGFILKIKGNGEEALAGTYFGSKSFDQIYFVEVGSAGNVFVTGQTEGEVPVQNVDVSNPNSGQFITKFDQGLTKILYSTVFGSGRGHPDISPSAFLVDICGNVYVSGWGGRTNTSSRSEGTSTKGLPVTGNAYQKTTDGSDFYLTVFRKGIDSLLYASFFGGPKSDEHVDGGTSRFDERGVVYQSVCGGCHGNSDFPVTDNAWSKTNNTRYGCNNAFFKIKLDVANGAPNIQDTFKETIATDTLSFPIRIKDPNNDSVYLEYNGAIMDSGKLPGPYASIDKTKGKAPYNVTFNWPTSCYHAGDTFIVDLKLKDDGCPASKTRRRSLKIIVKEPPVVDPPRIFCSYVVNDSALRLGWDDYQVNPYFDHFQLLRKDPDGTEIVLDSIKDSQRRHFIDSNAPGLRDREYCYYLRSVNVCGMKGPKTYQICTGPDHQRAPRQRKLKTATVVKDKHLKIEWEKATEPDFEQYLIYRKKRNSGGAYKIYEKVTNKATTSFIDKDVKVDETSYCYRVRVKDRCGFYSRESNKGCSIVLEGESEPFEHDLNWDNYLRWDFGVDHYTIYRRDPLIDTIFKPIAEVSGNELHYLDNHLNHDVGAYWYKVKANRSSGKPSDTGGIKSQSNTIYLEQAPLLHIPNAFSINQDGINETWGLKDVFVKDLHVRVYNRWGQLVYETRDKFEEWKGPEIHSYDEKFSDNVYIYMITYTGWDGSFHSEKGDLTILK